MALYEGDGRLLGSPPPDPLPPVVRLAIFCFLHLDTLSFRQARLNDLATVAGLLGGCHEGVAPDDQGLGTFAGKFIMLPEFDGVRGASVFTQTAEQASAHIDVENQGAAITLLILIRDNFNTIAGANLGAELASNTFDIAIVVRRQEMVATIPFERNPFFFIGILLGYGF
jgi:hypothetical protein